MPILSKIIIFSNEAHFDLGGYVNKQNCRIWSTENPHAYIEKPTHPKTSHCLVRILVQRHNCANFLPKWARTDRYSQWRSLSGQVERIFVQKIEEEYIGNIWFQQDGASCHIVEDTLDFLRPVFEYRFISRRADVVWPSRSCDLTSLDYYLWDAVKDNCYAAKPDTIDDLKDNIRKAFGEIQLLKIGPIV